MTDLNKPSVRLGDQRVCAICARVLERYTRGDEVVGWDHTQQDRKAGADHPAIPVLPDEINAAYRCDFCNDDTRPQTWVVKADNFELPGYPGNMSDGDWAACEICGQLIKDGKWDEVVEHSAASKFAPASAQMPPQAMRVALARLYHRLRLHMHGIERISST